MEVRGWYNSLWGYDRIAMAALVLTLQKLHCKAITAVFLLTHV